MACLWLQVVAVGRHSGEAAAYLGVSVGAVLFEQVGDQSRLITVDEACERVLSGNSIALRQQELVGSQVRSKRGLHGRACAGQP